MSANPTFNKENCSCNGVNLNGRVRFLENSDNATFKIAFTDFDEDKAITVRFNKSYSVSNCGNWQLKESSSWSYSDVDFTVTVVNDKSKADFLIYVAD